jgi:hypothetical protein
VAPRHEGVHWSTQSVLRSYHASPVSRNGPPLISLARFLADPTALRHRISVSVSCRASTQFRSHSPPNGDPVPHNDFHPPDFVKASGPLNHHSLQFSSVQPPSFPPIGRREQEASATFYTGKLRT